MEPETRQGAFFRQLAELERLTALFEYLPQVYLFVKDREHRFVKVNRAELQLHGFREESEMLGKTDFDLHPPALAAQYVEEDRRVMASGLLLANQVWLVTSADGVPRWFLSTKLPLKDARGRVVGIAGVMRPYDQGGEASGEYRRITPALKYVLTHFRERVSVLEMALRASFGEPFATGVSTALRD